MRMEVTALDDQTVILGPCPGCLTWTVDYSPATFASYEQCVAVVESILEEHLNECPHLQQALGPGWPPLGA